MRTRTDGRVQRGDQTRRAVLRRAVDIASVEGLEGLSLGRLAKELQVSKSGVFAHFGSKEELQLAAIRAGRRIFADHVAIGAMEARPGLERLWRLFENWSEYSRGRVFPGGCFFYTVNAEFESRPGRVRDALARIRGEWRDLLTRGATDAVQLGELAADTDVDLLVFELASFLETANSDSLLEDDLEGPYRLARAAVVARLSALATETAPRPWAESGA
ncbi:TetR/AcrR family transcriptional regulator [Nocardiopsis sp. N85]|uniref:TetR/AcrR family transcriptional regulator n=1 Tax=Nocardiopsis sp. N85 TaxID=3029400 RepID=UPI00237F8DCB|nr:TetR/AcrR family transcriptional regulator [Nocardiopsis sp. N85]MDE3723857.1 TetR/AcrR family transcriptional regulator [Nocardiopsis sp. N85]